MKSTKAPQIITLKIGGDGMSLFLDKLKWAIATILLLVGLVINHYYNALPFLWRLGGGVVFGGVILAILAFTTQGKQAVVFFRESRMELRKVVWPTRQETMQTTLVVAVMVIVLAFLLWGVDGALVWLIGWLTGQRG